jgi:hypothetical protein
MNISCTLFRILDKNFNDSFKVSDDPTLTGWNPTMSIQLILAQVEVSHGKPKGNTVLENNRFFKSPFHPTQPPKLLFHHIEQCQEIALIAQNPYTQEQLIANAINLLLQSGIFPMKEFKDWELTMVKM